MREDSKGQNLIDYAAKYKLFDIIERLMEAGVQCPADVKRRLARTQQKLTGAIQPKSKDGAERFEKVSEEEEIPIPEDRNSDDQKEQ